MKRFVILFILIVFTLVSCVGPSRWTKPDFRSEEFDKDRKECIETIDSNLDSESFGKALEECMDKKGYKYELPVESPPDKKETDITVGKLLLGIGAIIILVPLAAAVLAMGVGLLLLKSY